MTLIAGIFGNLEMLIEETRKNLEALERVRDMHTAPRTGTNGAATLSTDLPAAPKGRGRKPGKAKTAKAKKPGRVSNAHPPTQGGPRAEKAAADRARIEQYRQQHPDAKVGKIAAELDLSWGTVKKVLG